MLLKILGIQLTAGQHRLTLSPHQSRPPQAKEYALIGTRLVANHLEQPLNQVFFIVHAKQVVAQVVAKRASVGGGVAKQTGCGHLATGHQIQGSSRQIRMATQQRHKLLHLRQGQRLSVALVQVCYRLPT